LGATIIKLGGKSPQFQEKLLAAMSYIDATDTSLRKTGQIKLHGPSGFAGMRKAGALVAKCLDELTDIVTCAYDWAHNQDRTRGLASPD
jgi:methionyl aminopeptidase